MLKTKSLKEELEQAGIFQNCEARSWGKLAIFLAGVSVLLVLHATLPIFYSSLLVPITGVLCAVAAIIGHEGSHKGFSGSPTRNRLMLAITVPMLAGVSSVYWHHKHDMKHHAHPNVTDKDPDIALWPMAMSSEEYERSGRLRQWFQRHLQGILFWPMSLFMMWDMRVAGIRFLLGDLRKYGVKRRHWLDLIGLPIHLVGWVILPMVFFGPLALLLYVCIWCMAGLFLSAVFAPAHISLPVIHDTNDVWRLQFETTRNFGLPRWMSFFFIGLDYQLEHHLFPQIPHQRLPKAAAITKRWAAKHGIPYHEIGFFSGLVDVTRHMAICWKIPAQSLTTVSGEARRRGAA